MGYTMAEKILGRASGREGVRAGAYVTARPDYVMSFEAVAGVYLRMSEAGVDSVWDNERIVIILDHYSPAPSIRAAELQKIARDFVTRFNIKHYYGEKAGICHQVMPELGFVAPGRLIVATDSHTTTYGALGCAGTGIGYAEMAYCFLTGELWFRIPETIQLRITGKPGRYVMGKDIILSIAGHLSAEGAQYRSLEFHGPALRDLSLASRMTMSNMAVELGAKFGFFLPDEAVFSFLQDRVRGSYQPIYPDADAGYEAVHEFDATLISPQVALPPNVDDVVPVSEVGDVKIDQAFVGSCTNGRLEDLRAVAAILSGRKVDRMVRFIVTPASYEIYKEAIREGILETIIDAGGCITHPGCGACFGAHMGVLAPGEVCVSSSNRNFVGRMGSPEARIYLANPYVVAASAVAGRIVHPDEL